MSAIIAFISKYWTKATAGYRWIGLVGSVLAAGLTLWYMIQSFENDTTNKVTIKIQEEQVDTLERINEATNPTRNSTVDDSLHYLERR